MITETMVKLAAERRAFDTPSFFMSLDTRNFMAKFLSEELLKKETAPVPDPIDVEELVRGIASTRDKTTPARRASTTWGFQDLVTDAKTSPTRGQIGFSVIEGIEPIIQELERKLQLTAFNLAAQRRLHAEDQKAWDARYETSLSLRKGLLADMEAAKNKAKDALDSSRAITDRANRRADLGDRESLDNLNALRVEQTERRDEKSKLEKQIRQLQGRLNEAERRPTWGSIFLGRKK